MLLKYVKKRCKDKAFFVKKKKVVSLRHIKKHITHICKEEIF